MEGHGMLDRVLAFKKRADWVRTQLSPMFVSLSSQGLGGKKDISNPTLIERILAIHGRTEHKQIWS